MCRLVESIKLQNRQWQNIEGHNKRFNAARHQLFGMDDILDLSLLLKIPDALTNDVYKCRVLYRQQIESIEFQPYIPRNVNSLQLVEDNEIDYSFKYENRLLFDRLMAQKGRAEDILIVRNGCVTDTSYSNIVLFDGEKWITPDTCLLNGTQRQRMLNEGLITEVRVTPADLKKYTKAKPINAMLDFETTPCVLLIF